MVIYCSAKGQVLLDLQRLKAVEDRHGTWGVGYWIATALGQAIRDPSAQTGTGQSGPAANLQSVCFGGVLLGQTLGFRPAEAKTRLSPAFTAYPARLNSSQGTPAQRSYALLTGLGATASDCSMGAMTSLATGGVPDPERLKAFFAARDVTAEVRLINGTGDAAQLLLDAAGAVSADILVAGAFGHPRLQEYLFGGTTRTRLNNDGPSLFLSH
jgi:nucleotide-binding universal stress UspA family protein